MKKPIPIPEEDRARDRRTMLEWVEFLAEKGARPLILIGLNPDDHRDLHMFKMNMTEKDAGELLIRLGKSHRDGDFAQMQGFEIDKSGHIRKDDTRRITREELNADEQVGG